MKFFSVNRRFLPVKLHYALYYGGTGTLFPFMPVYAKSLGLTSRMIGTIYTILPILGLGFKPIFGGIADKFKMHQGVLLGWEFILMAAYFSCYFIPSPAHHIISLTQWQFWLFVSLLAIIWIGTAIVTTLSDTLCIEICGDSKLFGLQRSWGSWGWGLTSAITGILIDAVSNDGNTNYTPAFYLMLGPLIIDMVLSFKFLKVDMPVQSNSISKDIWKVLMIPRNAIFTVWCGFQGVSFALLWNFLYWHLEDLAGEGTELALQVKTVEGLVQGLQCFIGEGPAFFFSGWIVSKVGHSHAMSLVFLAVGIRFVLYSILVNPWWCLPIEFFQNQYGLFYSTMTSYAKKIGPPGTEATIQSVLCAVCEGVGLALGSYAAGYFYDEYGGSVTFQWFGILFFCLAAINECIEVAFRYFDRKNDLNEDNSNNNELKHVCD